MEARQALRAGDRRGRLWGSGRACPFLPATLCSCVTNSGHAHHPSLGRGRGYREGSGGLGKPPPRGQVSPKDHRARSPAPLGQLHRERKGVKHVLRNRKKGEPPFLSVPKETLQVPEVGRDFACSHTPAPVLGLGPVDVCSSAGSCQLQDVYHRHFLPQARCQ